MPVAAMKRIVYFGPDGNDPAVRRRISQLQYAGFSTLTFVFSRQRNAEAVLPGSISLGCYSHQSRFFRIIALSWACIRIFGQRRKLGETQLFIARNLDNLFLALVARRLSGKAVPVVYEVLDINPLCTSQSIYGSFLRLIEKVFLLQVNILVVSSQYFVTFYYHKRLKYKGVWYPFENKVPSFARAKFGMVRQPPPESRDGKPWRIGWFGYLDDEKSWQALRTLAELLPDHVEIYVRGVPYTNFDMARFLSDIGRLANVTYGGGFTNPDDLPLIYEAVDLVWSIDCNNLSANSKWLLTNSVYEAGFFRKPVIALRRTAVGDLVESCGSGWCLDQPVDETLPPFIAGLTLEEYFVKLQQIDRISPKQFSETDEIAEILSLVGLIERQSAEADQAPESRAGADRPRETGLPDSGFARPGKPLPDRLKA
jgi:succinoglycan biosynthesis protein ExoL